MEMGHPELHDVVLPRLLGLCLLATIVQQRGLCSKGRALVCPRTSDMHF